MKMIVALAVFSLGIIFYILSYLIQHRNEELLVKHKISITKEYTMIFVVPEAETSVSLVHNESKIDSVRGFRRELLKCYIMGEKGYYIINRFSKKMISYQNSDLIPKKYKHKFDLSVKRNNSFL